jgi:choline dehydrogenase
MNHTYDYIIVGGGTSGIVTAVRLAERSAASVCLIEAGPPGDRDPRILNYRSWVGLLGTEYDYDYEIAAQAFGNSRIRHSRARVLGGCSSHNSVIAIPSPDDDMRRWERLGAAGWGPQGTRDYFRRVAEQVHVTIPPPVNDCARDFMAAAAQAGYPEVNLRSPEFREGVGWLPLNIHGETRQSSAVAYLFPLERRPANLTVLTETRALRIVLDDGGEAVGVETDRGLIRARAEVILSAGAFDSPRLLLLSGIGPAEHLRAVGLPVRHDLPGVGENLQDHIEAVAMWAAARPVPEASTQHWENGLFARTLPGEGEFDMMMHFGTERYYIDFAALGYPVEQTEHAFCMTPNVARPRSAGVVRLRSADPADPPLIDPRYFSDPEGADERILVEGIRLARRLAAQPALKEWAGRELAPGPHIQSDADLGRYVRLTSNTVYHPSSTCRMGAADDPLAVVDPQLRVRGLGRLRVADASIFPSMIGVNLCITCMMVGEKCADLIL